MASCERFGKLFPVSVGCIPYFLVCLSVSDTNWYHLNNNEIM